MSLSLETVRAIARLLHETDLSEIEIDTGSDDSNGADDQNSSANMRAENRVRLQLRRGYAPGLAQRAPVAETIAPAPTENVPQTITSNAVGVFFADCEIDAQVKANQILGRVEALKIPHEVRAQSAGRVVALLVEDGQAVEYGQDLIAFEPQDS